MAPFRRRIDSLLQSSLKMRKAFGTAPETHLWADVIPALFAQ